MTDSVGTAKDVLIFGRDYNPETDEAFIYSTWRNGAFYGNANKDDLPPAAEFFKEQNAKIKDIISRGIVRVACIKDAQEVILGYSVFTGDMHLEWVFVKLQFRGKGIGRFLTVRMNSVSSDLTKIGSAIVKKKNLKIKRSPNETQQT